MKRIPALFLIIAAAVLATACPYESAVPLGDPADSKIDPVLPGEWLVVRPEGSDAEGELRIMLFSKKEYYIELRTQEKGKEEIERFRGFGSTVGRRTLLNIQKLGQPGAYSFYKYTVEGDALRIAYASDEYIKMKFKSPAKLAEFFRKNMDHAGFFEKEMVFRKKSAASRP